MSYVRLLVFKRLLAIISPVARSARMAEFERIFRPAPGTKIIDLGGTTLIWQLINTPLHITIVNLPGVDQNEIVDSHHHFTFLQGDATDLSEIANNQFEIAFSNSVIEHVGGGNFERRFAQEVRRVAPSYYVQTPSVWFPIEAHTGIPFWWALPKAFRAMLHRRWKRKLPAWNEMITGTTYVSRQSFAGYFPDATIKTERWFGFPKSYYAYRKAH